MRLTVGDLPPAVYWRRRALVVGVLVVIVVGIVYAVTADPAPPTRPNLASTSSPTSTGTATGTATPTPTAFTLPVATSAGQPVSTGTGALGPNCADNEILLTATSSVPEIQVGGPSEFTLTVKNISNRTCTRNIGSIPQELRLRTADAAIVWSSDDCATGSRYDDFQEFTPDFEKSFTVYWDGYRSRDTSGGLACERPGDRPPGGAYQIVARLGTLFSTATPVTLLSGS